MKVYILRHTETISSEDSEKDQEKSLSPKGLEDINTVALGIKKLNIKPNIIFHSKYYRTKQTGEIIGNVLDVYTEGVKWLDPPINLNLLNNKLKELEHDEIFLVCHAPDCGKIISFLISTDSKAQIPLKEGSLALCEEVYPKVSFFLRWVLTKKHLKDYSLFNIPKK